MLRDDYVHLSLQNHCGLTEGMGVGKEGELKPTPTSSCTLFQLIHKNTSGDRFYRWRNYIERNKMNNLRLHEYLGGRVRI